MPCICGEKHSRGWKIASEVLRGVNCALPHQSLEAAERDLWMVLGIC